MGARSGGSHAGITLTAPHTGSSPPAAPRAAPPAEPRSAAGAPRGRADLASALRAFPSLTGGPAPQRLPRGVSPELRTGGGEWREKDGRNEVGPNRTSTRPSASSATPAAPTAPHLPAAPAAAPARPRRAPPLATRSPVPASPLVEPSRLLTLCLPLVELPN